MAARINASPKETPAEAAAAAGAGGENSDSQHTESYSKKRRKASIFRLYSVNRWLSVKVVA